MASAFVACLPMVLDKKIQGACQDREPIDVTRIGHAEGPLSRDAIALLDFHEVAYWLQTTAIESRSVPVDSEHFVDFTARFYRLQRRCGPAAEPGDPEEFAVLRATPHSSLERRLLSHVRSGIACKRFFVTVPPIPEAEKFVDTMRRLGRRFSLPGDEVANCFWHEGTYGVVVQLTSGRVLHLPDHNAELVMSSVDRQTIHARGGALWLPHKQRAVSADELKAMAGAVEMSGRNLWPAWKPTNVHVDDRPAGKS